MTKSLKQRLFNILIEGKILSESQLQRAIRVQRQKGGRLGQILVEMGYLTEKDLVTCLGEQLGIPPINLRRYHVEPEVVSLISEHIARHYMLMPLARVEKSITVAMADPLNVFAMDDVRVLTGYDLKPVISTEAEIKESIDRYYRNTHVVMEELIEETNEAEVEYMNKEEEGETPDILEKAEEAPIIRLMNMILLEAYQKRASDIHIEPYEKKLRVRYRIDGVLQEYSSPPRNTHRALVARLKIMSHLDIAERRLAQDGRFKVKMREKEIDYRVSILPLNFGEKVVLRALDKSNLSVGLEKLGFSTEPLDYLERAVSQPYGMILVTGPTGSGKSTTLYSVLNELNTPERNIVTIEDPVEYQVEGITQMQVNPEISLSFSRGLRALLRQSPDVIMIGEIRDEDTADIAIKSALTGQLVFSTLHTNNAAGAVTRLIDMGIEPFLIASSVILIAAQRLVRKICPVCKESINLPDELRDRLQFPENVTFRGKGCRNCNNTGYSGRMGVLEVLVMSDEIKELVMRNAPAYEVENAARRAGMKTLRENALLKVKEGMTSLEEVLRVT